MAASIPRMLAYTARTKRHRRLKAPVRAMCNRSYERPRMAKPQPAAGKSIKAGRRSIRNDISWNIRFTHAMDSVMEKTVKTAA